MNIVHGTTQVTDEQIITILHLVLQVNCSPSLKEYLHSPVMTHLACNIQRTVSILCAHGVVCACVCVVLCAWMYMYICVLYVHVCVVVCTCALVCAFMCECLPNGGYKSTNILTCTSNHTSTKQRSYSFGNFYILSPVTYLQLTQCDDTVCTLIYSLYRAEE